MYEEGVWVGLEFAPSQKKKRFQSPKDMNIYLFWDLARLRTYSLISLRSHDYLGLE